jgi:beta-carotene 3-hydroxylase|tara:strand:+ start:94 stop:561 length:468 start_codon:yes stop_codon:yes gene_type:complete
MINLIVNILIITISFAAMEFVAWFTHKYIMHGFLWILHKDHHQPNHDHVFEKNDFFFIIFAVPGILGIIIGIENFNWPFWVGIGISLYGLAYFLIHDLFIHRRSKLFRNTNSNYLKALRKAHKIHHKNTEKHNCENFGMLFFPIKYWKIKNQLNN